MGFLSLPLTCVIIFISIYSYFKAKFSYWKRRNVPTLPASLPYGNFEDMGDTKHTSEIIDEIYTTFKDQARLAGAYFMIKPIAVVIDLDLIKDILTKDFEYFSDRPLYCNEKNDPLSVQLLTLETEKWKRVRSALSPAFSEKSLNSIFPTAEEISNRFVDVMEKEWDHSSIVNMKDIIERFTSDMIANCVFGVDCNSLKDPDSDFHKFAKKLFTEPRHSTFVMFLCAQFPKMARALGVKVYKDDVSKYFTKTIEDAIIFRETNSIRRKDLLDCLLWLKPNSTELSDEEKLTSDEIVAQLFILFKAGFQTTSTTVCYALHELAQAPSIQTKTRNEINEVLQRYKGNLDFESVMEMKYLDQIISETIRKYSPIPRLLRRAKREYKVSSTNSVIEKGTTVFIPVYSIHKDPLIFPSPDVFDPSRFELHKQLSRHPMGFLGFGDGPRKCIGQKFSRIIACIALVSVLRNFELRPSHKTPKGLSYNLRIEQLSFKDNMYFELKKI